jgi:hypothetical protein
MQEEEQPITVTLSLKQWRAISAHVEGGIYREVQPILASIFQQANPQIQASRDRAAAAAVAAAIKETEAQLAPHQPENVTDDQPENPSTTKRLALH